MTRSLAPFLKGIEDYVREVVGKVGEVEAGRQQRRAATMRRAVLPQRTRCPTSSGATDANRPLRSYSMKRFGFSAFRPNQEAVCRAVIDGQDVLLVMPTGAGKSLATSCRASRAAAPRS